MKLLDCTLRDGGYYTNWSFDDDFVKRFIRSLSMAGIDIIEMGYKSPLKGGKYRKCNDSFIRDSEFPRIPGIFLTRASIKNIAGISPPDTTVCPIAIS